MTLTINDLPAVVEQRLRSRAAVHGRSIEAEACEMLIEHVQHDDPTSSNQVPIGHSFGELVGLWKDRGTTDELMRELRGED